VTAAVLRLFIAVAVPPAVQRAVAEAAAVLRASARDDLRWTDPASWHLTVAFLGRTDAALVEPLTTALREVAASGAPFAVRLRREAGRPARGGVLWVELEPSQPFAELAAAVWAALRELGLPSQDLPTQDRPFRPHLTLARARGRASVPRSLVDGYHGPAMTWTVAALELVRSHLGRTGSRYETLATCPLGPPQVRTVDVSGG
jgi:2'-5' RNA ligase